MDIRLLPGPFDDVGLQLAKQAHDIIHFFAVVELSIGRLNFLAVKWLLLLWVLNLADKEMLLVMLVLVAPALIGLDFATLCHMLSGLHVLVNFGLHVLVLIFGQLRLRREVHGRLDLLDFLIDLLFPLHVSVKELR